MTKRKTKVILVILSSIFLLWNICWILTVSVKYQRYTEPIPKVHGVYFANKDGFTYNVKKPNYLRFTGNLGVSRYENKESLIIWPLLSGGYKYGIRLQKDGKGYEIYVDEDMNPINKDDTEAIRVLEKYKTEVNELFNRANEMWDFK